MTPAGFRRIALGLPEAVEGGHMGKADFRVGGKIFATLGYPDAAWGMAKLTPEQQEMFGHIDAAVFVPAKGAWGRRGATCVQLKAVKAAELRWALSTAWRNIAPKELAAAFDNRKKRS
jgi:hypothetical protein